MKLLLVFYFFSVVNVSNYCYSFCYYYYKYSIIITSIIIITSYCYIVIVIRFITIIIFTRLPVCTLLLLMGTDKDSITRHTSYSRVLADASFRVNESMSPWGNTSYL